MIDLILPQKFSQLYDLSSFPSQLVGLLFVEHLQPDELSLHVLMLFFVNFDLSLCLDEV